MQSVVYVKTWLYHQPRNRRAIRCQVPCKRRPPSTSHASILRYWARVIPWCVLLYKFLCHKCCIYSYQHTSLARCTYHKKSKREITHSLNIITDCDKLIQNPQYFKRHDVSCLAKRGFTYSLTANAMMKGTKMHNLHFWSKSSFGAVWEFLFPWWLTDWQC